MCARIPSDAEQRTPKPIGGMYEETRLWASNLFPFNIYRRWNRHLTKPFFVVPKRSGPKTEIPVVACIADAAGAAGATKYINQ